MAEEPAAKVDRAVRQVTLAEALVVIKAVLDTIKICLEAAEAAVGLEVVDVVEDGSCVFGDVPPLHVLFVLDALNQRVKPMDRLYRNVNGRTWRWGILPIGMGP
jgi:hypothetical protein